MAGLGVGDPRGGTWARNSECLRRGALGRGMPLQIGAGAIGRCGEEEVERRQGQNEGCEDSVGGCGA
jgi:hypothetical protein